MKYWNDMRCKWGFDDCRDTPLEAFAARYLYVAGLNKLLVKHRSSVRVAPWDLRSMHNNILIVLLPAGLLTDEELAAWNSDLYRRGELAPEVRERLERLIEGSEEPEPDEGWGRAWGEVAEAELDRFVEVRATIAADFGEWLAL
jgi:hypothetical protein